MSKQYRCSGSIEAGWALIGSVKNLILYAANESCVDVKIKVTAGLRGRTIYFAVADEDHAKVLQFQTMVKSIRKTAC